MSKELLLNLKFKSEKININGEEWEVREMSAKDASEYESSLFRMVNNKPVYDTKNAKSKMILLTLYKNNEKVFNKNDIGLIEQIPASIINKIFDVATKLNQMNEEENLKN